MNLSTGWSLVLSTLYLDDNFLSSERTGAIQLMTEVIDPHNNTYLDSWSVEDQNKYIPAIVKVVREHDNMYKKVIQMAKDAVRDLEL